MLYFRYRGATKGAEQFCYGILDADNVKGRKFYEVQGLFTEARQYQKAFSSALLDKGFDLSLKCRFGYDHLRQDHHPVSGKVRGFRQDVHRDVPVIKRLIVPNRGTGRL